ncbi:MAG: hypothetical protein ACYTG0_13400 [Planctomycetota bacterium]|jgi:hypothetical protein
MTNRVFNVLFRFLFINANVTLQDDFRDFSSCEHKARVAAYGFGLYLSGYPTTLDEDDMSHVPVTLSLSVLLTPIIAFTWLPQALYAHRPVFTKDAGRGPETAIPLTEPQVSQVVYREISGKTPQIWLGFSVPKDFELYVQIGVPVMDRLKEFRPSMVLVGPGLPKSDAPFAIPEGTGVKMFPTAQVKKPRFFHEHFTGTDSWILRSDTVLLSKPGRYYLVAYSPDRQNGKLWLSIGKKETFRREDWKQFPSWRKLIRTFHGIE